MIQAYKAKGMKKKCDLLLEKKSDSASAESRIKDVIRSLQEVEKVLEKINEERKEFASS
jgi:hypothetical protein